MGSIILNDHHRRHYGTGTTRQRQDDARHQSGNTAIAGFDAWDRETVSAQCVWNRARNGHHECSYIAQVRIRVGAGDNVIRREGSGSGHGVGPTPGEAHEHALKQAETDAMKRALVTSAIPLDWRSMTRSRTGSGAPSPEKANRSMVGKPPGWFLVIQ